MEVLATLPLIAVIMTGALLLLLATVRMARRVDATLTASRELRVGRAILTAIWQPIRAEDLVAWTDTSMDVEALVGVGVVCATSTNPMVLAIANTGRATPGDMTPLAPMDAAWSEPPASGDQLEVWLAASNLTDPPRRSVATLRGVDQGMDCRGGDGRLVPAASTHLMLSDTLRGVPLLGAPVRVTRRVRLALYRGGDGQWMMGRRTWGITGWEVIQPIVGPLDAPASDGLRITVRDATGRALATHADGAPASVEAMLHAPRLEKYGRHTLIVRDSLPVAVVLRADGPVPRPTP